MKKWERQVRLTIAEAGATVIERLPAVGHQKLVIRLPSGTQRLLTCSSSPRTEEHALRAIRREVEQLVSTDQPPRKPS